MSIKRIFFAMALAAICVSPTLSATTITIEIGQGGSLNWNGQPPPALNCTKDGSDCKITIVTNVGNIVSNGSYWHITGSSTAGGATVYPSGSSPVNYSIGVDNFTFIGGNMEVQSGWFSGVPTMSVPMEGVTSDSYGNISFDILKTSCTY